MTGQFLRTLKTVQTGIAKAGASVKEARCAMGADNTHIARAKLQDATTAVHEAWQLVDAALLLAQGELERERQAAGAQS